MTLKLGMFNVMEYLWETLEKTPDGRLRYTKVDVEMLWRIGFVDTKSYSLKDWIHAFEPYRQADETYLIDREPFIALDKYRYKGEIHVPFDAMLINEGLYTEVGLGQLIDDSIAPSCSLSKADLKAYFDGLKDLYKTPEGLIKIGRDAKLKIKDLIDRNPSPLRSLEILFDQMIAQGEDKAMIKEIEGTETEMVTARAAIEASHFSTAPTSRSEAMADSLRGLQKAKKQARTESKAEGVSLKKIRRSRKGMRG